MYHFLKKTTQKKVFLTEKNVMPFVAVLKQNAETQSLYFRTRNTQMIREIKGNGLSEKIMRY